MNDTTTHDKTLEVAVTGATGQQGGALARVLLSRGHRVRALTRNPHSPAALALAEAGADVRKVDLYAGVGLDDAVAGVDAVFGVTTPFERGAPAEVIQARNLGTAAAGAGVRHLVYSSVTEPMTHSAVEHFAAKGQAERLLAELGLPMTIIGSPPFLDNVIASWHLPWLRRGVFALPASDGDPMQMVLTQDIGAVAAHVLEHRQEFVGERLDIATETITGSQIKATLEAASGRTFRTELKSFAELDPLLGKLFAGMDARPDALPPGAGAETDGRQRPDGAPHMGRGVDIRELRERLEGVHWSSFSQWAREQNWDAILGGEHG